MMKKKKEKSDAIAADRFDSDGLEIVSIGSLCNTSSPSHKKYWSSSRGKDRYPYPVGYQAVRTHGDQTYKMEIRQGNKGPLFVVTSADGACYAGQTPDMAWESFQRKRVKNWHGRRRLSCVDGVELFGFRNASVQRLLRELVANVAGTSERSSISSDFSNKTSQLGHDFHRIESCIYTDFVSFLGKQKENEKRERGNGISCSNNASIPDKSLYPGQPGKQFCSSKQASAFDCGSLDKISPNPEVTDLHLHDNIAENQLLFGPCLASSEADVISSNDRSQEAQNNTEVALIAVAPGVPEGTSHETLPVDLKGSTVSKRVIPLEEVKLIKPEDFSVQFKLQVLPDADSKMFSDLPTAELTGMDVAATKDGDGEIPEPKKVEIGSDTDIHIPDTFDGIEDNLVASTMENCQVIHPETIDVPVDLDSEGPCPLGAKNIEKESTSGSKQPLPGCTVTSNAEGKNSHETPTLVDSEGMIPSQPGVSVACGSSYSSSERNGLDSAGQELARSMMSFLLPRAVPLLKRTYYRKRKRVESQRKKLSSYIDDEQVNHLSGDGLAHTQLDGFEQITEEKLCATGILSTTSLMLDSDKVMHPPAGFIHNALFEIESPKKIKAVIPDSFDDDQYASDATVHIPSSICSDGADKSLIDNVILKHNTSVTSSDSKLCKEVPALDENGCCKASIAPDTVGEKTLCDFPSFMGNSTFESLDLHSIGTSSIVGEEDAPCLDLAAVSNHVPARMQRSFKAYNNKLSMEHQNHDCRFKMNKIELLERLLIVCKETDNVAQMNSNQEKTVGTFMANAGANANTTCSREMSRDQANHIMSHLHCDEETVHTGKFEGLGEFSVRELNSSGSKVHDLSCPIPHFGNDRGGIVCKKINADDMHPETFVWEVINGNQPSSTSENRVTQTLLHTTIPISVSNNDSLSGAAAIKFESQKEKAVDLTPMNNTNLTNPSVLEVEPYKTTRFGECDSWKAYLLDTDRTLSENMNSDVSSTALYHDKSSLVEYVLDNKTALSNTQTCKENAADNRSFSEPEPIKDYQYCLEPLGCYIHPNPVLSISIGAKGSDVVVSVLSGLVESNERDIFVYKISSKQLTMQPSFVGYTPIFIPSQEGFLDADGKTSIGRSCLQFYLDAEILAFHNSIKVPCCREQNYECSCSFCNSHCCKESGIKIAHVKFGYVSVITTLVTAARVYCILICEPNYLIAAEGNGALHGWKMDSTWRDILEDFVLPGFDNESHLILELKRLPCHRTLILGHDGEGSFGLWDVCNRLLLGRFSSPGSLICQVVPVCACYPVKDVTSNNPRIEELDKKSTKRADALFFQNGENYLFPHGIGEGIAVWLLVLASSGSTFPHDDPKQESRINSIGWRPTLLFKNKAILGSILDPRACAVESTSGLGIVGTSDGLLYVWETSMGEKLMTLDPFNGGKISYIAADSTSGALAIAYENQLLVYIRKPH